MKLDKIMVGVIAIACTFSCGPKGVVKIGTIRRITGDARVVRSGERIDVKKGYGLYEGDKIETDKNGMAILSFYKDAALAEIQHHTSAVIQKADHSVMDMQLKRGSLWFYVKKDPPAGRRYTLISPLFTAVTSGAKLHVFKLAGMTGVCVCEGAADISATGHTQKITCHQNWLYIIKDGTPLVFKPEELKYWHDATGPHHHSLAADSPIGPKAASPSQALKDRFVKHAEEKIKAARRGKKKK